MKRKYSSGAQKRQEQARRRETTAKLPKISTIFKPTTQTATTSTTPSQAAGTPRPRDDADAGDNINVNAGEMDAAGTGEMEDAGPGPIRDGGGRKIILQIENNQDISQKHYVPAKTVRISCSQHRKPARMPIGFGRCC